MNKADRLVEYLFNCRKVAELKQEVKRLDAVIEAQNIIADGELKESEAILHELHKNRIERLYKLAEINKLDCEIIKFDLDLELRD